MTSPVSVTVNNEVLNVEDFWAQEINKAVDDEDLKPNNGNVTDEGEVEADWLTDVGFGEFSQQWRLGKSLPEIDLGTVVQKLSLRPHQVDAVRKRIRTLNATLKRKKNQRRTKDVRKVFQNEYGDENKDSSRSETPDSLDSGELLTHSGHSPPRRPGSPSLIDHFSELDDVVPSISGQVPTFVSIFDHHQNSALDSSHRNKDIFKARFPGRGTSHNNTEDEIATDNVSGVEILNYHNIGTIYMKGYIPSKKLSSASIQIPPSQHTYTPVTINTQQPSKLPNYQTYSHTTNIEINSKTFSPLPIPPKTGFTEELNKQNRSSTEQLIEDGLIDENSYVDPSGQTRLSDLSEEDVKNIRSLILMELTAQCDHLNIQIRRKKIQKAPKKGSLSEDSPNNLFGVSLDTLLTRDRRITGENGLLEVPIVFEKMISHLWKRSLGDEGLFRMGGHKGKINDLRSTFESSLYTEPEQVDAAMSQCSSHDVANLLKQFLRELPIPLLGYEYVDTFFDVAGELKDRNQENCLKLLVLLLPLSHQAVLRMLIEFLRDLVRNSELNKMSLKNVALILAPNLVPSFALRSQDKELSRAATWVKLTQIVIRYGSTLFMVPSDLISQMRQINDCAKSKKGKGSKVGNGKLMTNSGASKANCNSGGCNTLTVSAPQLGFPEVMIPINGGTTAGDIVLFLLEEADRKAEYLEREGNNITSTSIGVGGNEVSNPGNRRRVLPVRGQEINKNGPSLSCLLTQVNRDMSLKTHSLFEIGGNIGYRRVDPLALIPAICRDNPQAAWVLRCNHRHAASI